MCSLRIYSMSELNDDTLQHATPRHATPQCDAMPAGARSTDCLTDWVSASCVLPHEWNEMNIGYMWDSKWIWHCALLLHMMEKCVIDNYKLSQPSYFSKCGCTWMDCPCQKQRVIMRRVDSCAKWATTRQSWVVSFLEHNRGKKPFV